MLISESPALAAAPQPTLRKGTKAYDLIAATPLALWYAWGSGALLRPLGAKLVEFFERPDPTLGLFIVSRSALLLFAFAAILMLVFRSPPSASAKGIGPRVAALLGTYLAVGMVLLLPEVSLPNWAMALSSILILSGMVVSLYAILFLGRSFSLMAEARTLVTGGPYAHVRHPLYLGEGLCIVGTTLQFISPLAVVIVALQVCCQFYRMDREEALLQEAFPEYGEYKAKTARLLPGLY